MNYEYNEIHTIQIFREAKDDDCFPVFSRSSGIATTAATSPASSLHNTGSRRENNTLTAPSSTASYLSAIVMDGHGVGDDRAILDMVVTQDDDEDECDNYGFLLCVTDQDNATAATKLSRDSSNSSNFYSFFFDEDAPHPKFQDQQRRDPFFTLSDYEETIKENMDVATIAAITGIPGRIDDDCVVDDDFSITSQDTDSSPEEWMNLDFDENILQDSTSFWEHGLAAMTQLPHDQQEDHHHHQKAARRVSVQEDLSL